MTLFYDKDNSWYHDQFNRYEELQKTVDEILSSLKYEWENKHNLRIHCAYTRIKDRISFLNRVKKKFAIQAKDIEDILGARIICFTLTDVEIICDLLRSHFDILEQDDKSKKSGENDVGYRAVHLRSKIPIKEHPEFNDLIFEIQVRTVLQDAWAVISHDKKYKFGGHIPLKLAHTIESFSGTINSLDEHLNSFVKETNEINDVVPEHIKKIEEDYPSILDYIYTGKVYGDLNFSYRESKIELRLLQQEIFDSTIDIRKEIDKDTKLQNLLESILDSNYHLYHVARSKITFNENAKSKIADYMKNNLRATFRQNGNIVIEPTLTSFSTYWRDINFKTKLDNNLVPKKIVVNKNEDIQFDERLGIIDIWLNTVRLRHVDSNESCIINHDSYSISLKNIPSGVYAIHVKTEYEPSDDNLAIFDDLICIE